ncbi:MAG: hypothetical protein Q7T97_02480 [Burkholderiaceae bacterium]|nr:hypothetical protein [Burkholderiaceae bacterium]
MTTYAQLLTDTAAWINRSDLAAQVPTFVTLFESRANRRLRVRKMETAFTGTIDANNKIALPSDWTAFKTLWADGYESSPFKSQSLESVVAQNSTSGIPTMFAIDGTNVRFDGAGNVVGVYYQSIPGLVSSGTNWLCTSNYPAYLFGVLAEAHAFMMDEQRAAAFFGRSDDVLNNIMETDQRDRFHGPLVARVR